MNNKAQLGGIGLIIITVVGIITALVLYQAMGPAIWSTSATVVQVNKTYTAPAANGIIDLTGQELVDTPIVTNASSGTVIPSTNYTIVEGVSTVDGLKRIRFINGPASSIGYAGKAINISYSYNPEGYIDDSGGRAVSGLIAITAVIAIILFALYPTLKNRGFFDAF